MTNTKPKKLTLNTLNKYAAELNEKKTIYILDGKHSCAISKVFLETEIEILIAEYIQYIHELKNREVTMESMMSISKLLYALICKHFTDLPIQITNVDELVIITKNLLNTGIIEQLFSGDIDQGFDPTQIKKLTDRINIASKNLGQVIGEMAVKEVLSNTDVPEDDEENGE